MNYASHPATNRAATSAARTVSRRDADTIPMLSRWIGSWRISLHRRAFSDGELTRAYDLEAYHWSEKIARLGAPGAYASVLRAALADGGATRLSNAESPRVLDCGVGTGAFSTALARMRAGAVRLDAVDLSPMMLVEAERRLGRAGLAPSLHVADARCLPFADASFDLVLSAHMLEHLADPGLALAEMRRVLRPGGRIVLCGTRRSALGTLVRLRWRTHAIAPAEAIRWLGARGFEDVRRLVPPGHVLFNRLSVACTAVKA